MYCEFFGFKEKPFTTTPNPRFIFLSKIHREAFAHLLYGIDHHAGFIELTGEVGTGKTTVLRALLGQLGEMSHRTALILNPCLSAVELLRNINRDYGVAWEGLDSAALIEELNRFLLEEHRNGRTVVLVIDEAQNLEPAVLEQLRLVSNLETETDKLVQIVLAGQPELRQLLRRPELRQVGQRITVTYHLQPMDFSDTCSYIEHRLEIAGGWKAATFSNAALKSLYRYSGGTPRLLNIACDRALLIAYTEESREITGPMAARAIAEVKGSEPAGAGARRMLVPLLIFFALCTVAVVWGWFGSRGPSAGVAAKNASITEFTTAAGGELSNRSEAESAIAAFNTLAKLWGVNSVPIPANVKGRIDMEQLARERSLQLFRFSGNLGQLRRMDLPAILEVTQTRGSGRRYIAVTGLDSDRVMISPSILGRNELANSELESIWGGRGYILWRNYDAIPLLATGGTKGVGIEKLQQMLKDLALLHQEPTGSMDRPTVAAVRSFQQSQGVMADGQVGGQTLLLLYRANNRFPKETLLSHKGGRP
jgi:general secretion pathway protein A